MADPYSREYIFRRDKLTSLLGQELCQHHVMETADVPSWSVCDR